jgi:hypothetical protein
MVQDLRDKRGQHYWKRVVSDQAAFLVGLLNFIGKTEAEFEKYVDEIRVYRDKCVAHLDSENVMKPPKLGVAKKSVSFLYEYLLVNVEVDKCFNDAPPKASDFYEMHYSQGQKIYSE